MTASLLDKHFYYEDRFFFNLLRQRPVFRQIISCCKICLQLLIILGYLLLNIYRCWFRFFCPNEGRGSLFRWQLKDISIVSVTVGIDGNLYLWITSLLTSRPVTYWMTIFGHEKTLLKFNVCQTTLIISLLSLSKANEQTSQPPQMLIITYNTLKFSLFFTSFWSQQFNELFFTHPNQVSI